ncbi:CHEK1 isoform 16 [Pongo abelii]|uniref:CHEK1 isoform 16 n=1 Tax=Pongo abelii TaxID=9601 RepID=A0A2J8WZV9_PONAB|nr:CHEK1 isoform 16 [Pongo abelii]
MRSAVLKSLQPGSLSDCKATLGGSGNLSASVFWTFRGAGHGNARCLALRRGCASLRQRDASKFWREKRCIWIPAVVGKGQSAECSVESWQFPLWKTGTWCKPWEKVPMEKFNLL